MSVNTALGRADTVTGPEVLEGPARSLGLQLQSLEIREAGELDAAFEAATRERADAISVGSTIALTQRSRVIGLAEHHRLPAIYPNAVLVRAGGLMSYSASEPALFRRAAYYVDRILKG